ncbi:hypothetical protein O181_033712 [Austropuccinia psidii MF-1]|uniref:Uncharacterized protein n=1 Tax=Austropuccinia psidii MF-1 TaxID=1389203 RepID=A0A9Q3D561_9BASI|nr:hypothetical protein [Austropuccinia psidii MF-1]
MPMISGQELELSMSDSKIYKSHSEGSNRHLHEPVKAVLQDVQGQGLGNVATNPPRSDEFLAHPQIIPQRGIKEYHAKKREATKNKAPVASTSKPQSNPLPQKGKNNKKNWRKPYSPSYRVPKVQKDSMDSLFNMARTLIEFKDKEEQRMRQAHFSKK